MSRLGQPDVSRSSVVGPLAPLWAGFAADLERRGYALSTVRPYLRRCAQLSGWMEAQELQTSELSPAVIERFFAARRAAGYRDYVSLRGITPLLGYLRAAGLCPAAPAPSGPVDELLDRFGGWLGRERHLAPSSVATYVSHARALVERLLVPDRVELERLDAAAVRRFVLDVCPRQRRASAKLTVVAVRQLLRFLYVEGELDRPLAEAVPSVAGARLSGLPKRLAPGEVTRLTRIPKLGSFRADR